MGCSNEPTFPIKIFCFANIDNILQNIFPDKNEDDKDKWEKRVLKKEESFTENETKNKFLKLVNGKLHYILI